MTATSNGLLFFIVTYVNKSIHLSVCLGYMGTQNLSDEYLPLPHLLPFV